MARPAAKQLGIIGIQREVLAAPFRNPGLTATVLLLLLSCNFLLTFPHLSPRWQFGNVAPLLNRFFRRLQERLLGGEPGAAGHGGAAAEAPRFQKLPIVINPLGSVVAELTTIAMVYLSAVACKGKHAALGMLLSKVNRSWKKVSISSLYLRLFHLAFGCLFITLTAVMAFFELPSWVFVLVLLAKFSMICFTVVFSLYLDIVCRLSLVVSAVEEDKCGVAALARAFSLTRRRKLQGIVLMALCLALGWFTPGSYTIMGGKKRTEMDSLVVVVVWRFVYVLIDILGRLLGWLLWTVYYYECNKSHGVMGKEGTRDEGRSLLPSSYASQC